MNNQEAGYLFHEKECEGKSRTEIYDELLRFKASQIKFKELKKENISLIKKVGNLTSQICQLENKISKQKNNILIEGLGIKKKKEIEDVKGTRLSSSIVNVKRIIKFMEINIPYTKTDLFHELGVNVNVVEECLDFIIKYTNIKIKIDNVRRGCHYTRLE